MFLFLLGYVVVAFVLSLVGTVFLAATGKLDIEALAGLDVEEMLVRFHAFLFPMIIGTGIYSVLYTWAFRRLVDGKSLASLGLYVRRTSLRDFAKGIALAAALLGIILGISVVTGSIRLEGFTRPAPQTSSIAAYLVGALLAFLAVGLYEEIMFRGYILQNLNERAGRLGAVIISSFLFAILHLVNPGGGLLSTVNTWIIGVILCVLYFRSGSLWMPIGFHFAWNFLLGYVVSLPVSGLPMHGLLQVTEADPASAISGGSYGPEAGAACTIALAVWGGWLLLRRPHQEARRGRSQL